MNHQKINLAIRTTAVVTAVAAMGVVAVGPFLPLDEAIPEARTDRGMPTTRGVSAPDLPAPAALEAVFAMSLRQPLGDASAPSESRGTNEVAPALTTDAVADASAGPPALVGTIGDSLAMLKTSAGVVEVVGVGETLAGTDTQLLAVRPGRAEVRYGGQKLTLVKPAEPALPGE